MKIIPLSEVKFGSIGTIHWIEKTTKNLTEKEIENIRSRTMADYVYGSVTTAGHPDFYCMDVHTAMQRGANEANRQIELLKNGSEIRSEVFLVGDPSTILRLNEIESNKEFRSWTNPYIINQIKKINKE